MRTSAGQLPYRHLEAALANVTDGVITTDDCDQITYMNRAAETLTGIQLQDALGHVLADTLSLVEGDAQDESGSAIGSAGPSELAEGGFRNAVLRKVPERSVDVEYSVSPTYDDRGFVCGKVVVFRDVMRRQTAELALRTSEESLLANAGALFEEKERAQVTLNSIGDAVISTDFRGRVKFLNNIAEKMTGWTQAEASGRLLDDIFVLINSTTREHVACPTIRAIIEDRTVGVDATCALVRRDGKEIAVEDSASPIHDKGGGVIGAVMVAHDVTAARNHADNLTHIALHDNLTGLPNRILFADRLNQALQRTDRSGRSVSLLFVDLDRFKIVNDSLGHAIGDQLIQQAAHRLQACVRSSDTVGRYGGDEFTVMLADMGHREDPTVCARKVLEAINAPFGIDGNQISVGASIGIATYPEDAPDLATLMKYADISMYQAKAAGGNVYHSFTKEVLLGIKKAGAKPVQTHE